MPPKCSAQARLAQLRDRTALVEGARAAVREAIAASTARALEEEDLGWRRFGAGDGLDLSTSELRDIRAKCAYLFTRDPAVARATNLLGWGSVGRGVDTPRAMGSQAGKDEALVAKVQAVIDRTWEDRDNQRVLFGRSAMIRANARWVTDGALAIGVHTSPLDPLVKLSLVPVGEVAEVVTAPEDRFRPVAYKRRQTQRRYDVARGEWVAEGAEATTWYPDVAEWWQPEEQLDPDVFRLWREMGVEGQNPTCLLYAPVNTLGLLGVPEAYRVYDWSVAHAIAVSSGVTLAKALAMLAWDQKVDTKSQGALTAAAGLFNDPSPGVGSAVTHTPNTTLTPVGVPTGGVANMQTSAGTTLGEVVMGIGGFGRHWYGDPDTGNLATASAMELPAVWAIEDRQETFSEVCRQVLDVALARAAAAGEIPKGVPLSYSLDFPSANPRHQPTTALLLGAIGKAVTDGLILHREGSYQAYLLMESENIPELLAEQYPEGEPEAPEVPSPEDLLRLVGNRPPPGTPGEQQPTEQPEGVAEAGGDRLPFGSGPSAAQLGLEREFADAITSGVIRPWREAIRRWLRRGMVAEAIGAAVPSPAALAREFAEPLARMAGIIQEYTERGYNLGANKAVSRLGRTLQEFARGEHPSKYQAGGRTDEPLPTLADYLRVGKNWEEVGEDGAFNLRDERLLGYLRQAGEKVTGEVTANMIADLHTILEMEVYRAGRSPSDVAENLDGVFPETYAGRAENIARTEVANATSRAAKDVWGEAGIDEADWIAHADLATRDDHRWLHGKRAKLGEGWVLPDGTRIPHPGAGPPEQACNCRCDMVPVVGEDTSVPYEVWTGEERDAYQAKVAAKQPAEEPSAERTNRQVAIEQVAALWRVRVGEIRAQGEVLGKQGARGMVQGEVRRIRAMIGTLKRMDDSAMGGGSSKWDLGEWDRMIQRATRQPVSRGRPVGSQSMSKARQERLRAERIERRAHEEDW